MKSNQALCGQAIKKILKQAYPQIKFSIKSNGFSGGDSVDVSYTDAVPTEEIRKLIWFFQEGHFDGMNDIYEYSNIRKDIPQTKYLSIEREMSEETKAKIVEKLKKDWALIDFSDQEVQDKCGCWANQLIWRTFIKATVLPSGEIKYGDGD